MGLSRWRLDSTVLAWPTAWPLTWLWMTRVPIGHLVERVEQRRGHSITKFYGRPISWMAQFAPQGRVVKRIHRLDANGIISGVAYQRSTP